MDKADSKRNLYSVYKVALLGILAKRMNETDTAITVRESLIKWQDQYGGWVTDRTPSFEPDGVANIETTALSVMALLS